MLTVGGFHPAYKPPPLPFPTPSAGRSSCSTSPTRASRGGLFRGDVEHRPVRRDGELIYRLSAFANVAGYLDFDVLFQLLAVPLHHRELGGARLKVFGVGLFGIQLDLMLEGPTPWRAHGSASSISGSSRSRLEFDITCGDDRMTLPPVEVMPLLTRRDRQSRELDGATVPDRQQTAGDAAAARSARPKARCCIRSARCGSAQRTVPLDLEDRQGRQPAGRTASASRSRCVDGALVRRPMRKSSSRPAQFQQMDRRRGALAAAFEPDIGARLIAPGAERPVRARCKRTVRLRGDHHRHATSAVSAGASAIPAVLFAISPPATRSRGRRYREAPGAPFRSPDKVAVQASGFAVASRATTPSQRSTPTFASAGAAHATSWRCAVALKARRCPSSLHVIPQLVVMAA